MPRKSVNYVNELFLKSLCIRVKNKAIGEGTPDRNRRIDQLVQTYVRLLDKKYQDPVLTRKKNILKEKLKKRIIKLSELTCSDDNTYNQFASTVLLMIKHILTKPQFSNYTFKDEFYSDATYKIVKYIYNFNHKKVSKITGKPVNSFSYITQIIHNSIIFVINQHKKQQSLCIDKVRKIVADQFADHTDQHDAPECLFNDPDYDGSGLNYTKFIRSYDALTEELRFLRTVHLKPSDHIQYNIDAEIDAFELLAECYDRGVNFDVEYI